MLLSMLGALLLQAGTNLDNDVSDFERGTDRAGRLGLPRATALGLLTPRQVRIASRACFALATAFGLMLAWHGGWPILIAGIASAAAAMAYSGGPRPISYTPFGDFVVWLFFGLVAVCGTYYLQTLTLSPGVLVAATMVGLPATAVLVVNNYRDLDPDTRGRQAHPRRLARARLQPLGIRGADAGAVRAARPAVAADAHRLSRWPMPLLALPMAIGLVRRFWREVPGPAFNPLLARTAQFQVLFAALLCVGILLH